MAATLYACALVDIPALVTRFNVVHSRELTGTGIPLDIDYLLTLGPSAIPALDTFIAALPSGAAKSDYRARYTRAGLAADFLESASRGNIDLAILDIGMPEIDGLEVCRRIRAESALPILFLSARDDEIDRVVGFEIGGDDYVTKPFSPRELVARVKAILKRASGIAIGQQPCLTQGPIRLDRDSRSVTSDGMEVALTAVEFAILATILARPNTVFTREQLMGAAYGAGIHVADRTIDSHVRNIRAKFADAGCTSVIATVHGVGFKLAPALGT